MSDLETRCLKPEEKPDMNEHQTNMKNFENEDKKQDGAILSGFGKMLGSFIDGKNISDPNKKQKAEDIKKDSIRQASNILNDTSLDFESKRKGLEKLFSDFQKNNDAFPQSTEQASQSQSTEKEKSEKFLGDLMKTIGENRLDSQKMNANFAKNIAEKSASPASKPDSPEAKGTLNECLKNYP